MTVGQMFIELLRLLEVGDPTASKKQRSIKVKMFYEEGAGPVKYAHRSIVISSYRALAKSGITWDRVLTYAEQFMISEHILAERKKHWSLPDEEYTQLEAELNDALKSLLELEVARSLQ